jgi:predicted chitinase
MLAPAPATAQSLAVKATSTGSTTDANISSPAITALTVDAPSHRELKQLLKNPNRTAEEERRIAAWYWKEAQQCARIAQENAQLAQEYASRTRFEPNVNFQEGTLQHCRDVARLYSEKAAADRRVAQQHEHMAIAYRR